MAEPTSYSNEQIAKAKEAILNGEELNEQLLKIINSEKQLRDLLNQTRKSEEQIASDRAKYHEKRFAGIRRFHITANLEQVLHFDNVYSKKGGYKKNELSDAH